MQLLRKISRATMMGDNTAVMELCLKEKDKVHPLFQVYGYATGSRKSSDVESEEDKADAKAAREKFGPWECLIGAFEGINLTTGEVSRSGVVFLPQFAVDSIVGQFGGDVERVKFAFEVGVKFDNTTPTKYTYMVTPLLEPEENDPLSEMRKSLPAPAAKQIADKSKGK